MGKAITDIKNYFYDPMQRMQVVAPAPAGAKVKKAAQYWISPQQMERIRHDIGMWRQAVQEAENVWNPNRYRMQRMYADTILNEHVEACVGRRKDLTLLRKFKICDEKGNINEEVTTIFKKTWFNNFQSYCLDAIFNGYNLIQFNDLVNDAFPDLTFVKRQNVSPDRLLILPYPYSLSGAPFMETPLIDWTVYVRTPTETGSGLCGYGLFYKIAKTEILLRNNTGQNADFNEVYGQPIRKGTTTKQDEERGIFEDALKTMGSNAYILLDDGQDQLELVTAGNAATGYQTYADLEKRCEQKISKVVLGHADALDSTPGKLGGTQDGKESPAASALMDVQSKDAMFMEPLINDELIPRMRRLGFVIPDGLHFEYLNDEEKEEFRKREDESNTKTATLFKMIKDAGGDLTEEAWEYFEDRTGIPGVKKAEPPEPTIVPGMGGGFGAKPGLNGEKKPGAAVDPETVKKEKLKALQNQLVRATGFKRQFIKERIQNIEA